MNYFFEGKNIVDSFFFSFFKPFYDFNSAVAQKLHIDDDAAIYLIFLILSFILSGFGRLIPRKMKRTKYFYHLLMGFLIVTLQFQWSVLHTIFTAVVCYVLLHLSHLISMNRVKWIIFVFVFSYLCVFQIYELYHFYLVKRNSYRTVQMLMTLRLISLPFNIQDGQQLDEKKKSKKNTKEVDSTEGDLDPFLKEVSINYVPSLLQYFSFLFDYLCVNAGPIVSFKHYVDFIESPESVPLDVSAILIRIFFQLLNFFIYFGASAFHFNVYTSLRVENTKHFHFLSLLLYSSFICFIARSKYYFAWYSAEASAILAGLGHSSSFKKERKWEHVKAANMIEFDSSTSIRTMINEWNISVSKFFRYYVYLRIPLRSKTQKSIFVMMMSAFWHGFYPGYYIMWFTLIPLNQVYIEIYRKIRPRVMSTNNNNNNRKRRWMWKILLVPISQLIIGHLAAPFFLLSFDESVQYFNRFYWIFQIGVIASFIILKFIIPPYKKKKTQ